MPKAAAFKGYTLILDNGTPSLRVSIDFMRDPGETPRLESGYTNIALSAFGGATTAKNVIRDAMISAGAALSPAVALVRADCFCFDPS